LAYFTEEVALSIRSEHGLAKIITATNVFAHIEDVNEVLVSILKFLSLDGVFISESHYLMSLIETLQYDTIYHEHLRYYSLGSLQYLLNKHGLEIIQAKRIPTHGGSIRVYAARSGVYPVRSTVGALLREEEVFGLNTTKLQQFKRRVTLSKLQLHALLLDIKKRRERIYGISAPSRGSTLINYVGLDEAILDYVLEIKGSHKIGKYMPGTLIPVAEESILYEEQPEYALLLSWHIADELIPKISQKGFKGKFIVPLPVPKVVG
jgi:hypothetical protein